MPAAGAEWRAQQRATLERLAHERFVDDHVGELLESVGRRVRRRRSICCASAGATSTRRAGCRATSSRRWRTPARPATRRGRGRASPRTSRSSSRTCGATSSCAAATSRASPRSSGPTTRCSTTTSRGCAPPRPRTSCGGCARASSRSSRRRRRGRRRARRRRRVPGRRPAAPSIETILRQVGVDDAQLAAGRRGPSVRGHASRPATCGSRPATPRTTSTRSSARLHEFGHGLYEANIDTRARALAARHRRLERGPRVAEPAVGEHGRPRPPASGAGASRTCRARSRSASATARGRTSTARSTSCGARRSACRPTRSRTACTSSCASSSSSRCSRATSTPADLPEAWRERMRAYLGLEVPDDAQGVLQDVHWAEGLFGYFPTYAIGTIISGQLWAAPRRRDPRPRRALRPRRLRPARRVAAEHVHRYGRPPDPDRDRRRARPAARSIPRRTSTTCARSSRAHQRALSPDPATRLARRAVACQPRPAMTRRSWLMLVVNAAVWGASYMFIKVGARRVLRGRDRAACGRRSAGSLLLSFAASRGELGDIRGRAAAGWSSSPSSRSVVPFLLITYGENHISSSLTAILISSVPIYTALLATALRPRRALAGLGARRDRDRDRRRRDAVRRRPVGQRGRARRAAR